jgi:hypothetical protein
MAAMWPFRAIHESLFPQRRRLGILVVGRSEFAPRSGTHVMAQDLASPPPRPAEEAAPSPEARARASAASSPPAPAHSRPRYKSRPPKRLAPSSERAYRSFDRRRRRCRCAIIELRESEIDFFIKIGLLPANAPKTLKTLGNALNRYLDDHPLGGWAYKPRY